jgi:F-type H+-transporting ATPase subunit b
MEALGINLGLLIVQIIAFIIVFLTLNAWVYQPMLNMMENRKQKIAQGLEDARVAAEARANAEKEAAKIIAEAHQRRKQKSPSAENIDDDATAESGLVPINISEIPLRQCPAFTHNQTM